MFEHNSAIRRDSKVVRAEHAKLIGAESLVGAVLELHDQRQQAFVSWRNSDDACVEQSWISVNDLKVVDTAFKMHPALKSFTEELMTCKMRFVVAFNEGGELYVDLDSGFKSELHVYQHNDKSITLHERYEKFDMMKCGKFNFELFCERYRYWERDAVERWKKTDKFSWTESEPFVQLAKRHAPQIL